MKYKDGLSQEYLKQLIIYYPETGMFVWKNRRSKAAKYRDDNLAGCRGSKGYWRIKIDCIAYSAHRLAWLYMTGRWPKDQIDHINRIRTDNRWCNLREATNIENQRNTGIRTSNKSGIKGVRVYGDKFISTMQINKKFVYIGVFNTSSAALAAYNDALIAFTKPPSSEFIMGTLSFGT